MDTFANFGEWWKKPFCAECSAFSWFLFVGLIIVVIFLWTRILKEGGHVIEAVV
jgi:hypothetical protein